MLDTALLLTRTPKRALVDILNYHNGTVLEPDNVSFSTPVVVAGRKTQLTVTSTETVNATYTGDTDFMFNRLDLTDFFAPVTLDIEVIHPATTFDILNVLAERFNMFFDEGDFIVDQFQAPGQFTYSLKAHPNSLRWVGQVDLTLSVAIALESHIGVTTLDGLTAFPAETPLANLYQLVALNGLTYGDTVLNIAGVFTQDYLDVHFVRDELFNPVYTGNYADPALEEVRSAIDTASRNVLPPTSIEISPPSVLSGSHYWNSQLTVNATGVFNIVGSKTLYFNRAVLSEYFENDPLQVELALPASSLEIAQAIGSTRGLHFDETDFDSMDSIAEGDVSGFQLAAKSTSWRWNGQVPVTIVPTNAGQPLVPEVDMSGSNDPTSNDKEFDLSGG